MKKLLFLLCMLLCSYATAAENSASVAPAAPVAAESPAPVPGGREVDAAFVARLTAMHASGDAQQAAALAGLLDSLSPWALTKTLILASGSKNPEAKVFAEYTLAGLSPERTAQVILACDNLENYAFQRRILHMPDKSRLARVRDVIREDLERCYELEGDAWSACWDSPGIVDRGTLPRSLAWGVVNIMDDRLGTLRYDTVLEGYFTRMTDGTSLPIWYTFRTDAGKTVPVVETPATLSPGYDDEDAGSHYSYDKKRRIYRDKMRLLTRKTSDSGGSDYYYIVKMVPLTDRAGAAKKPRPGKR